MVFGWGKKENIENDTIVGQKEIEIHFTEIEKILSEMKDLRQKTLVAEINLFRNKMEPEKNQVLDIVNSLENDNLKINEMDPHLQGLVKRGKKEVISTIQNNSDEFIIINGYDDVKNFQTQSNRMLKKIGDVLGRHSRVIHIFAKKYAKQLTNYLKIIEEYNQDVKKSIEQFNQFENESKDIIDSKNKIIESDTEKDELKGKIDKINSLLNQLEENTKLSNEEIINLKGSKEYLEYQDIEQKILDLRNEETQIKNKIIENFAKISRPLHKYNYISSLDKSQKLLISKLESDPYDAVAQKNKSDLELILDSICKNVISGAISVKDKDKSVDQIIEIKSGLPELLSMKDSFFKKMDELKHGLDVFDNSKIENLEKLIKTNSEDLEQNKTKIVDLNVAIKEIDDEIPNLIQDLETNLYRTTSRKYLIDWDSDAI